MTTVLRLAISDFVAQVGLTDAAPIAECPAFASSQVVVDAFLRARRKVREIGSCLGGDSRCGNRRRAEDGGRDGRGVDAGASKDGAAEFGSEVLGFGVLIWRTGDCLAGGRRGAVVG